MCVGDADGGGGVGDDVGGGVGSKEVEKEKGRAMSLINKKCPGCADDKNNTEY